MFNFCDYPGCKDVAKVRPTVIVSSTKVPQGKHLGHGIFHQLTVGEDRYVHEFEVVAEYCHHHAEVFRPKRLLNEAFWSAVDNHAMQLGYYPPNRDSLEVRWEEAAGKDGLQVEIV